MEQINHHVSWSRISTDSLLRARNDGESGKMIHCGPKIQGNYDTPAHLLALVLILALSVLGLSLLLPKISSNFFKACGFPQLSRNLSKAGSGTFIFLSQHFGTGVLIATAFVHLLPTAFVSLTDPCLPPFFGKAYPPFAGLIAMISLFIVVGLEMFLMSHGAGHAHSHSHEEPWNSVRERNSNHLKNSAISRMNPQENLGTQGLLNDASPLPLPAPAGFLQQGNDHPKVRKSELFDDDPDEICQTEILLDDEISNGSFLESDQDPKFSSEAQQKRMMLQCFMLEAAILFHSVFIGMAVSVATGPPFVVFLIAVGFHQFFEGLALGSRIAAIHFPAHSFRPWLMVLAYGVTTPIGQAIGIVLHNFYNPQSASGLLMVGFMNAVSSGLLIYAGLVQLLAEDLLSDKSYETLKGRRRIEAFCSVIIGATLMSLVGAWA